MSNNNDPMGLGTILGCAFVAFMIFGALIGIGIVVVLSFQAAVK